MKWTVLIHGLRICLTERKTIEEDNYAPLGLGYGLLGKRGIVQLKGL